MFWAAGAQGWTIYLKGERWESRFLMWWMLPVFGKVLQEYEISKKAFQFVKRNGR